MRNRRSISMLLAVMLIAVMVLSAGCGGNEKPEVEGPKSNDDERADWPSSVTMIAGPMGGPWYPVMILFSEYLNEAIPEISWTVIDGGALANIRVVNEGIDAQIGLCHHQALEKAMEGTLSVMEGEVIDRVSVGNAINVSHIQIVAPASRKDINNLTDLFDKKYAAGPLTSAQTHLVEDIFGYYGESYDTVKEKGGKIEHINFAEMATLLQDGHIDAACFCGDIPHASGVEADISVPLKMLDIDEEALDAVIAKYPSVMKLEAPADVYKGMTKPVFYPGVVGTLIYNKDKMPGDLIYEITRVLLENNEEIREAFGANNYLDLLKWDETLNYVTEEKCDPDVWRAVKEGPSK